MRKCVFNKISFILHPNDNYSLSNKRNCRMSKQKDKTTKIITTQSGESRGQDEEEPSKKNSLLTAHWYKPRQTSNFY